MKFSTSLALLSALFASTDAFTTFVGGNRNVVARHSVLSVTMAPVDGSSSTMEDDEDETPNFIVNASDLDAAAVEDTPSARAIFESKLLDARANYKRHETDTGSPEYQVAGMTERISYLTSHLQTHPKDFSTRRGLVALVNKRRRLLNYLFTEDVERYKNVVASLGIRHKAPGRVMSRAEKYSVYQSKKKK